MLKIITCGELKGMIDKNEDFILVDVSSSQGYEKEHIPGSINIPLEDIKMKSKGLVKNDKTIVVYCGSFQCTMSSQPAEILTGLSYEDIYDFEGGLQFWKYAGFSIENSKYAESAG